MFKKNICIDGLIITKQRLMIKQLKAFFSTAHEMSSFKNRLY